MLLGGVGIRADEDGVSAEAHRFMQVAGQHGEFVIRGVVVEEFPADEFDLRLTPEVDTFRAIARHTLNAGDGLTGLLLSGVHQEGTVPKIVAKIQTGGQQINVYGPVFFVFAGMIEKIFAGLQGAS